MCSIFFSFRLYKRIFQRNGDGTDIPEVDCRSCSSSSLSYDIRGCIHRKFRKFTSIPGDLITRLRTFVGVDGTISMFSGKHICSSKMIKIHNYCLRSIPKVIHWDPKSNEIPLLYVRWRWGKNSIQNVLKFSSNLLLDRDNFSEMRKIRDFVKGSCCCRSPSFHCDSIRWLIHGKFRAFTAGDCDLVAT